METEIINYAKYLTQRIVQELKTCYSRTPFKSDFPLIRIVFVGPLV